MKTPKHEDLDITETTVANADQINVADLAAEGATFTVVAVSRGPSTEQPIDIHTAESPGKPWRPCKTMRRLLRDTWGIRTGVYAGRLVRLYVDPTVTYGKNKTGGIRVGAVSHIEQKMELTYQVRRGVYQTFIVQPLELPHELADLLREHGIPESQLNAWLRSRDLAAPVPTEHQSECAAWIVREGLIDEIKAFEP